MAVAPSGLIYMGGEFTACEDAAASFVVAYDPGTKRFSTLGNGADNGTNDGVKALAVIGGDLYVGGFFTRAGGQPANRIARWDGKEWSSLGGGTANGVSAIDFTQIARVTALASQDGDLYVGGVFTSAGGPPAANIARWNGSSWSNFGSGVDGQVRALAVQGTSLFAGGLFRQAGGIVAAGIARWNGSSWSNLGSGVGGGEGNVHALAVAGGDLYVGGDFASAGGQPANHIARWSGQSWSALGSGNSNGLDREVLALAVDGDGIYEVDGHQGSGASVGHARWRAAQWRQHRPGDLRRWLDHRLRLGRDQLERERRQRCG